MADKKNKLDNLKPWKPGESGNPAGRQAEPEALKKIRKLTKEELDEIGDLLFFGTLTDLRDVVADQKTPVLKLWIAKMILRAVDDKDPNAMETLERFLDRLIGKTPTTSKLDVTGNLHTALVGMIKRLEDE